MNHRKNRNTLAAAAVLLSALLALVACDKDSATQMTDRQLTKIQAALEELSQSSDIAITDVKKVMKSENPLEEIRKLRQLEYKVVSFPADTKNGLFEMELNALGRDFWDCFHVQESAAEVKPTLYFFCKRKKDTLLHYVPQSILGR